MTPERKEVIRKKLREIRAVDSAEWFPLDCMLADAMDHLDARDAEVERLRVAIAEIALYFSLRRSPDRDALAAEECCAAAERIANAALVPHVR